MAGGDSHDRAFHCPVCEFKQPFVEREMYSNLRGHLRKKEMVPCPCTACKFKTNGYSTFNALDYDVAVVGQYRK